MAVVHYQTAAGTPVHTEEGLKPIEKLKIGDQVLSYNENTKTLSYQPVTDLIQGEQQYRLIEITLDSGKSIEATAEHPFYIKGKGWNPASSLSVGQVLELHNGTTVVVKEIDTSIRRDLVYNLTVANTHNYFVGEDGVLVHNAGWTTIIEEDMAAKKIDDLKSHQKTGYQNAIETLAKGKAGKNQHPLGGNRKGQYGMDLPGSGKRRGAVRIVYSYTSDGCVLIEDILDYHGESKKKKK